MDARNASQKKLKINSISLPAAISIGIGGMIGAGIFSILGVVAETAGAAMWVSFLIGGVIALFCTYSYAKLGARFPTAGGAVQFLVEGFGVGPLSGSVNIFMWLGYIISIALYAHGFAAYFIALFTLNQTSMNTRFVACGIVLFFNVLNMLGAQIVGQSELLIVAIKVSILAVFALIGLFYIHPQNLAISHWGNWTHIIFGAGILFIGYEGFGLITNAAADLDDPQSTLPKALYWCVFLVIAIYVLVSITVVGNLSAAEISASGDYALAEAAKPFLGELGFKLIAVAALFSTASAINATLFGAANVCYMVAKDGELPDRLDRKLWRNASGGLMITAALSILFILLFKLSGIAMMGSGAFLLIYAAVNAAHLKVTDKTGGKRCLVWISLLLCLGLFILLEIYTFQQTPLAVYVMLILLLGSFIFERVFRLCR